MLVPDRLGLDGNPVGVTMGDGTRPGGERVARRSQRGGDGGGGARAAVIAMAMTAVSSLLHCASSAADHEMPTPRTSAALMLEDEVDGEARSRSRCGSGRKLGERGARGTGQGDPVGLWRRSWWPTPCRSPLTVTTPTLYPGTDAEYEVA